MQRGHLFRLAQSASIILALVCLMVALGFMYLPVFGFFDGRMLNVLAVILQTEAQGQSFTCAENIFFASSHPDD